MTRPARIWVLFALCLAVALGGLGWITVTTLALDRAQAAAEQQSLVEENTRLALWRLDSAVLPILLEENSRPYYQYSAQYHIAPETYANDAALPSALNAALATSPLSAQAVPFVKVYFQVDPRGDFISPQVPGMVNKTLPESAPGQQAQSEAPVQPVVVPRSIPADNLLDLQQWVAIDQVRKQMDAEPVTASVPQVEAAPQVDVPLVKGTGKGGYDSSYAQSAKNSQEYKVRQETLNRAQKQFNNDQPVQQASPSIYSSIWPSSSSGQSSAPGLPHNAPATPNPAQVQERPTQPAAAGQVQDQPAKPDSPSAAQVREPREPPAGQQPGQQSGQQVEEQIEGQVGQQGGQTLTQAKPEWPAQSSLDNIYQMNCWYQPPANVTVAAKVSTMQPIWEQGRLLLTRKVDVNDQEFIQGAWLDWPALQKTLQAEVADLLPEAKLEPIPVTGAEGAEHRMALLPVRLLPGMVPFTPAAGLTPVESTLLIAWIAIGLAALAAGALLQGVVALSERRAAFVSAVTHELRTPLTTFRMYTEMLGAGMVKDEAKRAKYLETMRSEAVRLGHLVENVLAYAKLERTGAAAGTAPSARIETLPVADLLVRLQERLSERATQAGMSVIMVLPDGDGKAAVKADPGAVEQILFNLVDNACKYARPAAGEGSGAAGAAAARIAIRAFERNRRMVIEVRDFGPGVAADQQPRLFQPFSRSAEAAANSATRTPGVGLGLALSRRLARAMGGELAWISHVQDGASFELSLPLG